MNTQTLDPQAAEQLRLMDDFVTGAAEDMAAHRAAAKNAVSRMTDHDRHPFDGMITDTVIEQGILVVPVRRYEPYDLNPGMGIVYFHGGGWVFGDLDTGDRFARSMAGTLGVVVVSVDYRRAPEHPYPAAVDDCVAVAQQARDEFHVWCAVAGDSAGGNLAAATALAAQPDRGFDAQILLYPCLDASMTGASYQDYADGYGLTRQAMEFFWDSYAADRSRTDPLLSPQATASVRGLPPTVLVTAGFDVLLEEGRTFANRLLRSDVAVTYLPFPSLPHGFIDLVDRVDSARAAVEHVLIGVGSLRPGPSLAKPDTTSGRRTTPSREHVN